MKTNDIMVAIATARETVVQWVDNFVWVHGFTEKECAHALNTSISTISRIVTYGENAPLSDKMFLKLADRISELSRRRYNYERRNGALHNARRGNKIS